MKTIVFVAIIFAAVVASSSSLSLAQSVSVSDIQNVKAESIGYRIVVEKVTSEFVRFNEYYSESYAEIYDENGNLIDIIYGGQIYSYRTMKHKIYPIYEYCEWMNRDESYVIYDPCIPRDYKYYGPKGKVLK